jgi:hypothetical protein
MQVKNPSMSLNSRQYTNLHILPATDTNNCNQYACIRGLCSRASVLVNVRGPSSMHP